MYLIGDIGNTEIKICLINSSFKIIKRIVLSTNLITNRYLIKKLFILKSYKGNLDRSIFCSVVPKAFKIIKKFIKIHTKTSSKELKELKLKKIIRIRVNKKQVGSDRLANAISAMDNKSNYIIVDFGTATTFDVIKKNQYLGGVIAPGVNLSLTNLISKASLIPKLNLTKIKNIVGKNTKNAVKSGFFWGYSGLVENIIKIIIKQTKRKYKIIFTGGQSHLFKNSAKRRVIIDRDLTIKGVIKVLRNIY